MTKADPQQEPRVYFDGNEWVVLDRELFDIVTAHGPPRPHSYLRQIGVDLRTAKVWRFFSGNLFLIGLGIGIYAICVWLDILAWPALVAAVMLLAITLSQYFRMLHGLVQGLRYTPLVMASLHCPGDHPLSKHHLFEQTRSAVALLPDGTERAVAFESEALERSLQERPVLALLLLGPEMEFSTVVAYSPESADDYGVCQAVDASALIADATGRSGADELKSVFDEATPLTMRDRFKVLLGAVVLAVLGFGAARLPWPISPEITVPILLGIAAQWVIVWLYRRCRGTIDDKGIRFRGALFATRFDADSSMAAFIQDAETPYVLLSNGRRYALFAAVPKLAKSIEERFRVVPQEELAREIHSGRYPSMWYVVAFLASMTVFVVFWALTDPDHTGPVIGDLEIGWPILLAVACGCVVGGIVALHAIGGMLDRRAMRGKGAAEHHLRGSRFRIAYFRRLHFVFLPGAVE